MPHQHVANFLSQETASSLQASILLEVEKFLKTQLTYAHGWPARPDKGHKMCRLGDANVSYDYRGKPKPVHAWTPSLIVVRDIVAGYFDWQPNCVVVNTYAPTSSLYPHNDSKYIPQLGTQPTIVSISFGAARTFRIYPINAKGKRSKEFSDFLLGHGDLFVMSGDFDANNHHSIPAEPSALGDRLSLTFRKHMI